MWPPYAENILKSFVVKQKVTSVIDRKAERLDIFYFSQLLVYT